MLMVATGDRLIPIQRVCQNCLMANQAGEPRWGNGELRCGRAVVLVSPEQPEQFDCEMGFRVIKVA